MKPKNLTLKFRIGSTAFFEGHYEDFDYCDDYKPHNYNFLAFSKEYDEPFTKVKYITVNDYFIHNIPVTKDDLLKYKLERCKTDPIHVASVLSPTICDYFNITPDDLKPFEDAVNRLGKKHEYLKLVFDFYQENGNTELSDKQRDAAYKLYKDERKRD